MLLCVIMGSLRRRSNTPFFSWLHVHWPPNEKLLCWSLIKQRAMKLKGPSHGLVSTSSNSQCRLECGLVLQSYLTRAHNTAWIIFRSTAFWIIATFDDRTPTYCWTNFEYHFIPKNRRNYDVKEFWVRKQNIMADTTHCNWRFQQMYVPII